MAEAMAMRLKESSREGEAQESAASGRWTPGQDAVSGVDATQQRRA